jgi:hypothetical protein
MRTKKLLLTLLANLVLAIYLVSSYSTIYLFTGATVRRLASEDRYFENIGTLGLFVTGILFLVAYFRYRKKSKIVKTHVFIKGLAYLLLAAAFLAAAGEEISWGQRIFGFETPSALEAINAQEETNFHNLSFLRGAGDHPYLFRLTFERLTNIFWFILFFTVPVAATLSKSVRQRLNKYLPIGPWPAAALMMANYSIHRALREVAPLGVQGSIDEIKESNFGILFAAIAVHFIFFSDNTNCSDDRN